MGADMSQVREDQSIAQTLMVSLTVVVGYEIFNCCPQSTFSK